MNKKRYIILSIIVIIIFLYLNSTYSINNYAEPIVVADDIIDTNSQHAFALEELYAFDYNYKDGYVRYCTKYAIFYYKPYYLNEHELIEFAKKVDDGIIKIEDYLNIELNSEQYINSRIFVNIDGSMDSLDFNNENIDMEHTAIINIDNIRDKYSSYIHELTHIIAYECSSTWLKEGLAIYLNDKLNEDFISSNNGYDIDKLAIEYYNEGSIESLSAFNLLGENGIPNYANIKTEEIFFTYSASFVKYIESSIGVDSFINIYKSSDSKNTLENTMGKDIITLKNEWIDYLSSNMY